MRIMILEAQNDLPSYLLGSYVNVHGACLDTAGTDGQRSANTMVVPNWGCLKILKVAPDHWRNGRSLSIAAGMITNDLVFPATVRIRGKIRAGSGLLATVLEDGTGSLPVEFLTPAPPASGTEIECLGRWCGAGSNSVLRAAVWREVPPKSTVETGALPVLTTALQVEQLPPAEAKKGYPIHLKGVVTWISDKRNSLVLQDSTRGVFVMTKPAWVWAPPKVGENFEINGVSMAQAFAPVVYLRHAKSLGLGIMPLPLEPIWNQLIGGSLDCQYVEIRGLVTDIKDNDLQLLMPGGKLDIEVRPNPSTDSRSWLYSVVRIRGVMFAKWDRSHQVTTDKPLWMGDATIGVEIPAPADPFAADALRAKQLAQFDVRRDIFRRVKVVGQILYAQDQLYYAADEGFGFRFQLMQPQHFEPGDNIEVAGLVQLGGMAPLVWQAVARKVGQSPLPLPQPAVLEGTNVTRDSTRVWIEGVVVDSKDSGPARILEMRSGHQDFIARVALNNRPAEGWQVGSRLRLTGVYSSLSLTPPVFELLVNSTADVRLLERPPFWTLTRLSLIVAALLVMMVLVLIWIYQLREQVKHQVLLIEGELISKERAERAHAIEQERSRIARDLHDDLGSSLTAINMLAVSQPKKLHPSSEEAGKRFQLIAQRSHSLLTALDEIVWAVNPKNDNLQAMAEYLASYAEEFLGRAEVPCKVELPRDWPERMISAEVRHNLLLSTAEILNNAVRHGQPTRVLVRLKLAGDELQILVQDNGSGFEVGKKTSGNGLANIQERMRKINGHCCMESSPGAGTSVYLRVLCS